MVDVCGESVLFTRMLMILDTDRQANRHAVSYLAQGHLKRQAYKQTDRLLLVVHMPVTVDVQFVHQDVH